ncbi:DUF1961 family protein [Tunicatimonas pelagia]|uniref:DUF1961 family protein n=1 Tax=Tunicatimonas pelagia TaxID=931531 RepID=UPI002666D349|nr:DUF1961 family protein [Tunicatimonas pelagia]WKN45461.1 DUF1961 family protein [Tunicatimonas pelagia]
MVSKILATEKVKGALILSLILVLAVGGYAQDIVYFADLKSALSEDVRIDGSYRILDIAGRKGVNTTSIHSKIILDKHLINNPTGSITMWVSSLEEIASLVVHGNMRKSNQRMEFFPFLSDNPNPQDFEGAHFKFVMQATWHPNLQAMFAQGKHYEDAFKLPHRALVTANHFSFDAHRWYLLTLTWNHPERRYRLYVNGVRVGADNQYHDEPAHVESAGDKLFTGNPALVYSTISFYHNELVESDIYKKYREEAVDFDADYDKRLKYVHAGVGRKQLTFTPDDSWTKELDLSLTQPEQLDTFYIQGLPVDVTISDEGLLVETIDKLYTGARLDSQVYLWIKKPFEGDLYVACEFQSMRRGGLSLLMTQASGMNREDFMADYPLRTSGRMSMVCWEDVRNYHWEYYRDMADVRNDVLSSALMKNPFMKPLAYGCLSHPIEINTWYTLQFLQQGNKLIGAIDGVIMVEAEDDGHGNDGPVLNFGRVAIRAMLRSKMMYRNLKIYNRHPDFEVIRFSF